jgi:hypothetical protein
MKGRTEVLLKLKSHPWLCFLGIPATLAFLYLAWRYNFGGLLASILMAVFTALLWRVNRDLRDLQVTVRKSTDNPDLRAYAVGGWKCDVMRLERDDGPGKKKTVEMHERWESELVLWNTGTGSLLVVDWAIDAFSGTKPDLSQVDNRIPIAPPLVIPGGSAVRVRAYLSGVRCKSLYLFYSTSKHQLRRLVVSLTPIWGFNHLLMEYGEADEA